MTVYVITHKPFRYADKLPSGYLPMMVGANSNANPDNYLADNTLENISDKNPYYCELTGLYWIWKNSASENVGLAHYRRYFYERDVISEKYPDYVAAFDEVMHSSSWMSPYNMFYASKNKMDEYCKWLFDILFEVEKRTDMSGYTDYQKRLYGFLSERLLNVWLKKHSEYKVKYLTVFKSDDLDRKALVRRITNHFGITKGVNN